jgi:hypothetical protein
VNPPAGGCPIDPRAIRIKKWARRKYSIEKKERGNSLGADIGCTPVASAAHACSAGEFGERHSRDWAVARPVRGARGDAGEVQVGWKQLRQVENVVLQGARLQKASRDRAG